MILSFELMILGIITLIYITLIIVVAVKILAKYFEVKNKAFLYAGLACFGLVSAWSGVVFNFIIVVFFDLTPSLEIYFLLHGTYIPISLFFWIVTCLYLSGMNPTKQKGIKII